MTRNEAKRAIFNASENDKSSPKNCIHLLSLHSFIEKIYDSFEEAMKHKTCDGCSNLFFDEIEKVYKCSNDVSDDVGYLHGEAVIRNIKDFHCVQHQPKDNQ